MRKSLLSLIVGFGVLLGALCDDPAAYAQRRVSGGGSSGRSYSSGSSSSSRSTSSHTSPAPKPSPAPSRPSTPAPSRPSTSGKSYSSGGHSTPVAPSPKKSTLPASSTPEKKNTTTAPRQSFPANTAPRNATFDEAAAAAQKKEQSRVAYTNKSFPTGATPGPATPTPTPTVRPSGKTYSKNGYDSAAAQAQRHEESRIVYQSGAAPKPTYKTPGGVEKPIEPKAPEVEHARRSINPDLWRTRSMRTRVVYGPYYGRPTVVYNDPYNSFFWYWLSSQSLDSQASWAYHHRYAMDRARYNDLMNRNATLAARVNQLEESKVARDTSFTPTGIDPDLMYTDAYLDAAYNPQAVNTDAAAPPEIGAVPAAIPNSLRVARAWKAFWQGILAIAMTAALTFFLIWLIFIKRWGGDRSAPKPSRPRRPSRR